MGRGGARPRARRGPADPALDRLRGVPLVPRDGARVVRGRRDRGADERALRQRQGRPRGAPGPRRDLHGRRRRAHRARRLADDRLPHAGRAAVLRRHVLPARAAPRAAELPPGARGRRVRVRRAPRRRHALGGRARRGDRAVRRAAVRRASRSPSRCSARPCATCGPSFDPGSGGFGGRRSSRRTPSSSSSSAAASWRWSTPTLDGDGRGRHVRRRRRRLPPLLRSTTTGSCRTSRRCSTTTRCSCRCTSTAGS